ncbi:MAG TPA: DoxX family membrane protein [Candidatus Nanoarchaeia archaeon]|nr:DoxX family membrane protein [Candidatus Nanoarchaeia archaeon]
MTLQAKYYAPAILRIGMALVFLWFSINQFFFTNNFIGFVPEILVSSLGVSPAIFVIGNALIEFIFGVFLILGIHVRTSAFILSLHLFGIAFSLGYNTTMIRDLGLATATAAVFFYGNDEFCLSGKK